jgi:hypothetical protein
MSTFCKKVTTRSIEVREREERSQSGVREE